METINIRPASLDDAKKVAELLYLSMSWIKDFMKLENKSASLDFLEEMVKIEDHAFSFDKISLAEANEEVVGLLLSYPGGESMKLGLKTAINFRQASDYFSVFKFLKLLWATLTVEKADKREYYISNLGVEDKYRKLGIGENLLTYAENKAVNSGYKRLSLLVRVDNEVAKNLYYKYNYKIINVFKFNKRKICKMIKDI